MPQLNPEFFAPQLIWLAITFLSFYFFLSQVVLPRIGNVLEERSDRIARDLDEAERLKEETQEAIASYEQALADARANAHKIAQETKDKLSAEIETERAEVDREIASRTEKAEERISAAKASALSQVNEAASDTATAIVEKLIGQSVDKGAIEKAVAEANTD